MRVANGIACPGIGKGEPGGGFLKRQQYVRRQSSDGDCATFQFRFRLRWQRLQQTGAANELPLPIAQPGIQDAGPADFLHNQIVVIVVVNVVDLDFSRRKRERGVQQGGTIAVAEKHFRSEAVAFDTPDNAIQNMVVVEVSRSHLFVPRQPLQAVECWFVALKRNLCFRLIQLSLRQAETRQNGEQEKFDRLKRFHKVYLNLSG